MSRRARDKSRNRRVEIGFRLLVEDRARLSAVVAAGDTTVTAYVEAAARRSLGIEPKMVKLPHGTTVRCFVSIPGDQLSDSGLYAQIVTRARDLGLKQLSMYIRLATLDAITEDERRLISAVLVRRSGAADPIHPFSRVDIERAFDEHVEPWDF